MGRARRAADSTPAATTRGGTPAGRLARLWRGGARPDLDGFLAREGDLPPDQLAAVFGVDLRGRWGVGDRPSAESYLTRSPAVADDPDLALDLVYGEFLLREAAGESPAPADYRARFPALASALELQVNFHRALDRAGGGAEPRGGDADEAGIEPSVPPAGVDDAPAPTPANLPLIAGYEVRGELGAGGMGVVYRAIQVDLKRPVALKMLLHADRADPEQRARFRVEAEAAASLHHPNIVEIYEFGEFAGCPYVALELVEGGNLAQQLCGAPLSPRKAGQLMEALARAMQYAHGRGVVHRDLKPANILLTPEGTPKIADFGLAKILGKETDQTRSGTVLGSPCYMSPEQAAGAGHRIGPASDVYSLGAILYELLTGVPPFRSATALDTLQKMMTEEPARPSRLRPGIPRDLETIALKCLEKEPARRYAAARELAEDLDRFLNYEPVKARPIAPAERLCRWCRRKAALAMTLAIAAVAALVALGVSISFAAYQYRAATQLKSYVRQVESRERQIDRLAADLAYDHGHGLCERGDVGQGMLWLVHGLAGAAHARSAGLERAFRLDLAGWRPRLHPLKLRWENPAAIKSMALSSDGTTVAIAGDDHCVRLWEVATGRPTGIVLEHPGEIQAVAFGPDGRTLLTGCVDWNARLWDVATGRQVGPPLPHGDAIFSVAFSPDGTKAITGILREARFWDVATGRPIGPPLRHGHVVRAVAFSPDGRIAMTGGFDRTARLWDVATGRPIGPPLAHDNWVSSVAFSPDGRTLVTGCYDGTARLWDRETWQPIGRPLAHQHCIETVAFSPDGTKVLTGCLDGTARLWEADSGRAFGSVLRHRHAVEAAIFSPDGSTVLTGGADRAVQVWEVSSPTGLSLRHAGFISKVIFGPDGKTALSASLDRTVQVWKSATAEPIGPPLRHGDAVWGLAVSPDGATVLTGSDDGTARLWELRTGRPIGPPLRHAQPVKAVAFGPDGKRVLTGSDDGTARLWDAATGEPVGRPLRHGAAVGAVEFSPDGRSVLTGSHDGTARLWDAATGEPVGSPFRHQGQVRAATFSPDGKRVLTGSDDMTARLWDAVTGLPLLAPLRHDGPVSLVAFSPEGQALITGGWDRVARLWDPNTGRPVAPPLRHDGRLRALAISPDGRTILTGSYDRTAQLWDKATGRPIGPAVRHDSQVWFVAFSPDGRTILSGGQQDVAHIRDFPTASHESAAEIELATQVATGMALDDEGNLRILAIGEWTDRRDRLVRLRAEAGGHAAPADPSRPIGVGRAN